jgi:uncharacterized protein (TIGR02284 family)
MLFKLYSPTFLKKQKEALMQSKINPTTQLLNDLISINTDRIACYQAALTKSNNLDADLCATFNQFINEATRYRVQLVAKVEQMDEDVKNPANILGKIYMAWTDLKVALANSTQKAIISSCMYNEEIALQAYRAALSNNANMPEDVRQLLMEQENGLRKNYELIRSYRDQRHHTAASLVYFT